MLRTSNPALHENTFRAFVLPGMAPAQMTLAGTVNRTGFLLFVALACAAWPWQVFFRSLDVAAVHPWILGGAIAGAVFALATIFKPAWAAVTAPLYAAGEGFFLGGLSALFEAAYPMIVIQAVGLTFGTLCALLLAYKSGLIRPTENFKLGVTAATGAIVLVYLAHIVMRFFGSGVPFIHDTGPIGIGLSVVIVVVASLNLVLDFDFIEGGVEKGAPKHMEWYAAFGLMLTLVWMYLEFLRLLAKLRER